MHFILESIPSPSQGVWHLGFFPIRAYAICIIVGIFAAAVMTQRRWSARGGKPGEIYDMALWIVPMGIIGGRIYHVITDHQLYFGHNAPNPWYHAFFIWDGGLGVWGAIALPAVRAIWVCRSRGARVSSFGDAIAPALLVAQGIGRWGNYFNQELFGRPTSLPWGLEISPEHRPAGYAQYSTFHPTFLYESIWDLGAAALVLWLDRKLKLGYGRCFALYVMAYTAGRFWIEALRIDVAANDARFLGLRFNDWTAIVCFVAAAVYFLVQGRKHKAPDTRPESVYWETAEPEPATAA